MTDYTAAELIAHYIEKDKRSRKEISAGSGVSESTLSRIVNAQPVSINTLKTLASYYEIGDEFISLVSKTTRTGCEFADQLCDELDKIRTYYEEKGVNIRKHYENQIALRDEQNQRQQEEREREREMHQDNYDKVVNYLKDENARLRSERDSARETSLAVVSKKHRVFGVLAVICVVIGLAFSLLIVLLIIAFKTDAIL